MPGHKTQNKMTDSEKSLFPDLIPAFATHGKGPLVIAGPCSAESRTQLLETAARLRQAGFAYLRAGAWKPRTMPGCFEGRGETALPWLAEAQNTLAMPTATEIANADHLTKALDAGIRILWVGARTSANPFAMQEIADALADRENRRPGTIQSLTMLVKNPVNPDIDLWIGAISRLYNAGVRRLGAVHRGFSTYGQTIYRNAPCWAIPIELHRRIPALQIICDPSHIGGKRDLIAPLMQEALDLGFDGFLVESHIDPDNALSDSAQQVTPENLRIIVDSLVTRRAADSSPLLNSLRAQIDSIDDRLIQLLSERMEVSRAIGRHKKETDMPVMQPDRYDRLMTARVNSAAASGLSEKFMRQIFSLIHQESVSQQSDIMQQQPAGGSNVRKA